MVKKYSMEIVDAVKNFLDKHEWKYYFREDTGIFEFGLSIRGNLPNIKYLIDIKEDKVVVYGVCPVVGDTDDADQMAEMAEFICRANYGLMNGCFEFDFRDGEIRYRSFVDCEGITLSEDIIKNCIYCIAGMYSRYTPGITDVLFRGSSAADAIAKCEKKDETE